MSTRLLFRAQGLFGSPELVLKIENTQAREKSQQQQCISQVAHFSIPR